MLITLSPDAEQIVRNLLEKGRYRDANDVVDEALKLLAKREEEQTQLLDSINEALEELRRGGGVEYTAELREEMFQNAMRRAQAGEEPHPDVCPPM